jgi:pimeloyl-ACP methyl ester carboxylesterase
MLDDSVNFISKGDGPPVILIHGMAASLYDWSSLMPELSEAGYQAFAMDLLGHGGSIKPEDPKYYHVEHIYQHFSTWLEGLHLGNTPVLVGHSLGGYLSLMYAIQHPGQVRAQVLIDPFYETQQLSRLTRLIRHRPNLYEKAIRMAPEWMVRIVLGWIPDSTSYFSPEVRKQIAADYKRASPHFVYITREMPDLTSRISQVETPSLVIWGERDFTLRPASFPKLVELLPHARGYPVADTGHQPHISHHVLVNQLVLQFLENLE